MATALVNGVRQSLAAFPSASAGWTKSDTSVLAPRLRQYRSSASSSDNGCRLGLDADAPLGMRLICDRHSGNGRFQPCRSRRYDLDGV
jgi:hypothetical protein